MAACWFLLFIQKKNPIDPNQWERAQNPDLFTEELFCRERQKKLFEEKQRTDRKKLPPLGSWKKSQWGQRLFAFPAYHGRISVQNQPEAPPSSKMRTSFKKATAFSSPSREVIRPSSCSIESAPLYPVVFSILTIRVHSSRP